MKQLILASTSKYRKNLLKQLQWPFEAIAPQVDESIHKQDGVAPQELAEKLSLLKARSILNTHPEAVVIGSDQVCSFNDIIFDKPENSQNAFNQLKMLAGNSHQLLTAVTILSTESSLTWTNITTLTMRKLSDEDIKKYIEIDRPFDCSGSYKLESMGIKLFSKIEMSDHSAIIGLPLIDITNHLMSHFGFEF